MGHTHHHAAAGQRAVTVEILIVSSTRTLSTDEAGPVLVNALEAAGHRVTARRIVPDDPAAIRKAIQGLRDGGGAQAVILSGGTGISRNDGTFEAVSRLIDRPLPGFGELFRVLSFHQIGAAAMLSRATAGVAGSLIVFSIPGSVAACELAVHKLILPELSHIVYELGKEGAPAPEAEPEAPAPEAEEEEEEKLEGGVHTEQIGAGEAPEEDPDAPKEGWLKALEDEGGALDRKARARLPPGLAGLPAVTDVLNSAGEQAVARFEDEEYAAYGFPDLLRPSSKVLLIGPGAPYGEVLALHRWPTKTGVCRRGGGKLVSRGRLGATAIELTGKDYPGEGRLLAVEGDAVYVVHEDRVHRWDGARAQPLGAVGGALASLLLRFSQR